MAMAVGPATGRLGRLLQRFSQAVGQATSRPGPARGDGPCRSGQRRPPCWLTAQSDTLPMSRRWRVRRLCHSFRGSATRWSCAPCATTTVPGNATLTMRLARLTVGPKKSASRATAGPEAMPTRTSGSSSSAVDASAMATPTSGRLAQWLAAGREPDQVGETDGHVRRPGAAVAAGRGRAHQRVPAQDRLQMAPPHELQQSADGGDGGPEGETSASTTWAMDSPTTRASLNGRGLVGDAQHQQPVGDGQGIEVGGG